MTDNTIAPKNDRALPPFSLRGKTAVVSGAGAEIGLAVTQGFAEAGANVAIWYNSNKRHLTVLRILRKHTASSVGGPVLIPCSKYMWPDRKTTGRAYQVDVTDETLVKEAVNDIVAEFNGQLDIFVTNSHSLDSGCYD